MIINHNLMAMNANRMLNINTGNQAKTTEQLSSGLRINRAGDDAAGLAISEKMRGQIRGLDQASRNSQDGISMIQTAEGALNETHDILQRMRELATQSANDTNTASDRGNIQKEVDQLAKEITRISNTTEFNKQNLLAGGLNDTFQIGANAGQNIQLSVNAMDAKSLGVSRDINLVSSFTNGTSGLNSTAVGNTDLGSGLAAGTYKIDVVHTNAATTVNGSTTPGGTADITKGGSYTGTSDANNVQFKITGVDVSNKISAAQYSTDGGATWNAANVSAPDTITFQGATLTSAADTAAGADVGKVITASFAAQYDTVTLENSTGTAIGTGVKAYQGQNSVTIGNSATNQTVTVNSTSLGSLTTNTADTTFNVASQASTAAVVGPNNTVTTQAVAQAGIDVSSSATAASNAITTIDNAIQKVSAERGNLGAYQNRLEHTINNLGTSSENLTNAESRIRDTDMSKTVMANTKNGILAQAAQAMLAQANQQPQQVLQLLR